MDEWSTIERYTTRAPVDVVSIIRELGILYREIPMPESQSGFFRRRNGLQYEIGVNSNDSPQRRRFTAAHELGHFVLHRDKLRDGEHMDRLFGVEARNNPAFPFTRHDEIQANAFAADIIMPARSVLERYSLLRDIQQVASYFGVSKPAMEIRLKNLGVKL